MTRPLQVLIVEDNEDDKDLLLLTLQEGGFAPVCECVSDAEELKAALDRRAWDIVVADFSLPGFSGFEALRLVRERDPDLPFVVVSGAIGEDLAVAMMKAGAHDYHRKGNLERLPSAVNRELRAAAARRNHRLALQALRDSETQFRQLAENIPQVFWIVDLQTRQHVYVSPAYERIFGRSIESLRSDPASWRQAVHPEDRCVVRKALRDARLGENELEFRVVLPDGTTKWLRQRSFPVADARGNTYRIAGITEDITSQKEMQQRLLYLARHDNLTGLPNRVLLCECIHQALSQATNEGASGALLLINLDRFRLINATFGHGFGNRVLQEFGKLLLAQTRAGDTVCRLSGDEFALLLPEARKASDAAERAREILAALATPLVVDGREVFVSASIGIALYPLHGNEPDALLGNATAAMYCAKDLEHSGFHVYTEDLSAHSAGKLRMEVELRRALKQGEFLLYYQPRISLTDGRTVAVEALLRWQHPERGLLLPGTFVPLLEETGLIVPVGEWVLREACRQMKAWLDGGATVERIAVNVSPRQFRNADLVKQVREILSEAQLDGKHLELEITESLLMENEAKAAEILRELRASGIHLSVDDFGTGYSNLGYLKHLPVNLLKIDRSFVKSITSDPGDASIARAIIGLAQSLGLGVVAEGVETEAQAAFLFDHHCDELQGYFCAPALPADACRDVIGRLGTWVVQKIAENADRRTVLIVGDEDGELATVSSLLRREGYRVLAATSACEGFALLATGRPAVVLSQRQVPDMSGIDFFNRVNSLYPNTVRIMLSDHADPDFIARSVNEGAIHQFLTTPLNEDRLRTVVREAFQRYELMRENERLAEQLREANETLLRTNRELERRVEERARELLSAHHGLKMSHLLLEELPFGIIGIGHDDIIAIANRRAGELLGRSALPIGELASECLPSEIIAALPSAREGRLNGNGLRFRCLPLHHGAFPTGHLVVLDRP